MNKRLNELATEYSQKKTSNLFKDREAWIKATNEHIDSIKFGYAAAIKDAQVLVDALEYIAKSDNTDKVETYEIMHELGNARLFDISKSRKALAEWKRLQE